MSSPVMQEGIFGPILPVLEVENAQEAVDFFNARPSPLGLYVFAEDQGVTKQILNATTSGDAAVNDCMVHPLIHDLSFGGVGNSGMGKYHGEWGFRAARTRAECSIIVPKLISMSAIRPIAGTSCRVTDKRNT